MINYELVLLGLNESKELKEPLVLIYPQEGIITADYPLMLLDSAKRQAYDRLVEFIRSPEFQEEADADHLAAAGCAWHSPG